MRAFILSVVAAMLAPPAFAQSPKVSETTSAATNSSFGQIAPGEAIVVELAKSVDARKAKADDKVEARLTMDMLSHGEIVIPRGTKITGRVTAATPKARHTPESSMEINFDRVVLKNKRAIPLKVTIQAVGAPMQVSSTATSDLAGPNNSAGGPGSSLGRNGAANVRATSFPGSIRPTISAAGAAEPTGSATSQSNPTLSLGPTSHGVVGIRGIVLSNVAQGSAITSTSGNVHLHGGTQLVLHVNEPQVLADSLRGTRN
jgi:hypothetical protein